MRHHCFGFNVAHPKAVTDRTWNEMRAMLDSGWKIISEQATGGAFFYILAKK